MPTDFEEAYRIAEQVETGRTPSFAAARLLARALLDLRELAEAREDSILDYDEFDGTDIKWDEACARADSAVAALRAALHPEQEEGRR